MKILSDMKQLDENICLIISKKEKLYILPTPKNLVNLTLEVLENQKLLRRTY